MRVVIAEDQALLRSGIIALLRENDVDVVAQTDDGPGLLRIIGGHKPDLAIVDVRLPPRSPTRVCARRSRRGRVTPTSAS